MENDLEGVDPRILEEIKAKIANPQESEGVDPRIVDELKTRLGVTQQPKPLMSPTDMIREEGLVEQSPLNLLGTASQAIGKGSRAVGEAIAETTGNIGAPVGIPALMAGEFLDPQTRAGQVANLLALGYTGGKALSNLASTGNFLSAGVSEGATLGQQIANPSVGKSALTVPERTGLSAVIRGPKKPLEGLSTNLASRNYAEKANKLTEVLGTPEPDLALGTQIQQAFKEASKAAKDVASKPYEALKQSERYFEGIKDEPINLSNRIRELKITHQDLPKELQNSKIAGLVKSLSPEERLLPAPNANPLDVLAPKQAGKVVIKPLEATFSELLKMRSEIGKLAARENKALTGMVKDQPGMISNEGRILLGLEDAIDSDINNLIRKHGNADLVLQHESLLNTARTGWRQFKETFAGDLANAIIRTKPSDLPKKLANNPEGINFIQSTLGEAGTKALKQAVAKDLIERLGKTNIRNPSTVLDNLLKSREEEIGRLFSPKEIDALRNFASARQSMLSTSPTTEVPNDALGKAWAIGRNFLPPQAKIGLATLNKLKKIAGDERGAIFPKAALEDMVKKPILVLKEKLEAMPKEALEKRIEEISSLINKAGEETVKATEKFGKDSPEALKAAGNSHDLINKLMPEWTLGREHLKDLAKAAEEAAKKTAK